MIITITGRALPDSCKNKITSTTSMVRCVIRVANGLMVMIGSYDMMKQ